MALRAQALSRDMMHLCAFSGHCPCLCPVVWNQTLWLDALPRVRGDRDREEEKGKGDKESKKEKKDEDEEEQFLMLKVMLQERVPLPMYDIRKTLGLTHINITEILEDLPETRRTSHRVGSALSEDKPDFDQMLELENDDGQLIGVVHCRLRLHFCSYNRLSVDKLGLPVFLCRVACVARSDGGRA